MKMKDTPISLGKRGGHEDQIRKIKEQDLVEDKLKQDENLAKAHRVFTRSGFVIDDYEDNAHITDITRES